MSVITAQLEQWISNHQKQRVRLAIIVPEELVSHHLIGLESK